jgi:hypothetical protein
VTRAPELPYIDRRRSPLWTVTREPLLHQFVGYLQDARRRIDLAEPGDVQRIELSRSRLGEIQHAFRRMLRRGEGRLHRLSQLLSDSLYVGGHDLLSVVVGEIEGSGDRFTLSQDISPRRLYELTDLELGDRLLRRVRLDGRACRLIANRVEYLPKAENAHGVHKIVSRIKAEEELWNKVIDELFDLDALVRRDKQLRHLSRYVKDVFGIKVIVSSEGAVRPLHATLTELSWTRAQLRAHDVEPSADTVGLTIIETKDYFAPGRRKGSGWAALKSAVTWGGGLFELQVQPLVNYYAERERLTRESHAAFKQRREDLRREVERRVPLMGFYRRLLRWVFDPVGDAPQLRGVEVVITD